VSNSTSVLPFIPYLLSLLLVHYPLVLFLYRNLGEGVQGFLAKWMGFSCEVDRVFLQSGRGFLAKWTGFSCKVDGGFLQSGQGFPAKWMGFSRKVDGVFLCIAKVKSTPSPRPKTGVWQKCCKKYYSRLVGPSSWVARLIGNKAKLSPAVAGTW